MNDTALKNLLQNAAGDLYERFKVLDQDELKKVIEMAKGFNTTNCWFGLFYAKEAIIKICEGLWIDLELAKKDKSKSAT